MPLGIDATAIGNSRTSFGVDGELGFTALSVQTNNRRSQLNDKARYLQVFPPKIRTGAASNSTSVVPKELWAFSFFFEFFFEPLPLAYPRGPRATFPAVCLCGGPI